MALPQKARSHFFGQKFFMVRFDWRMFDILPLVFVQIDPVPGNLPHPQIREDMSEIRIMRILEDA